MPYLSSIDRHYLENREVPATPGELNFLFCRIVKRYLSTWGESYKHYNEIIGALECAKLEIYRRLVASYEDKKIKENGDVF